MSTHSGEHTLGDLQHAIMDILWRRGEATVSDVHEALWKSRKLAPTTVATMLVKLERKGVVVHRTEGRRYIYRPLVSRHEVRQSMVADLVDRLFGGDPSALVSHLVDTHAVDADELHEIERILARRSGKDQDSPDEA